MSMLRELFKLYFYMILIFFIGRLSLFIIYFDRFKDIHENYYLSFLHGLRMDTVIVSLLFERGAGNAADDHPPGLRQRLTAPVLHRLAGFHGKLFRLLGMDRGDAGERAARDLVGRHVRLGYFRGERR